MSPDMPDDKFNDAFLEEALARHVAAELRLQSGRAEAGFIASRRRARQWRNGSMIAAAAAVLLAAGISWRALDRAPENPIASVPAKANETPVVECVTYDKTFDAGAAEVNGIPGRAYRREIIEQTQCFDPKTRTTLTTYVPREQWEVETLEQY